MPKTPISVTLDSDNLVWLRGRAATQKRRSVSETLDDIVTAARTGAIGSAGSRSVVGTIDIADDDPGLERADEYIRAEIEASLGRSLVVRDRSATYGARPNTKRPKAAGPIRRPRRA